MNPSDATIVHIGLNINDQNFINPGDVNGSDWFRALVLAQHTYLDYLEATYPTLLPNNIIRLVSNPNHGNVSPKPSLCCQWHYLYA